MKYIKNLLIYLKLKSKKNILPFLNGLEVDFVIFENSLTSNFRRKKFNSSYYGDPYPYDWYSSRFLVLAERKVR